MFYHLKLKFFLPLLLFLPIPSLSTVSAVNCTLGRLSGALAVITIVLSSVSVLFVVATNVCDVCDPDFDILVTIFTEKYTKISESEHVNRKKLIWATEEL